MLKKKVLVIALNLFLTIGAIACVVHAQENDATDIAEPLVSVAPAPTPDIPQIGVSISMDNEDKYMALNSVLTLSAEATGVPEGMQITYFWQERQNSGEWADIGSSEQSVKIILSHAGKIESEYRCSAVLEDSSVPVESNILAVSKIVYKEKLNVKLGDSFNVEDIFGGVSVKGAKCDIEGKYSKCINESKKKGKKIFTVTKYYTKIPFEIFVSDDESYSGYVCVKKPVIKDFAKDIKINISKNKTKLTAKFKNIAGISVIKFKPKGLKTDIINKKESKGDCTVVYRYKAKFKMKKFSVCYGYKPFGSKKVNYTKPVNVSI